MTQAFTEADADPFNREPSSVTPESILLNEQFQSGQPAAPSPRSEPQASPGWSKRRYVEGHSRSKPSIDAAHGAELLAHERLLKGDATARDELCERLLHGMLQRLASSFPQTEDQLAFDAVVSALLEYFDNPASFDPNRGEPLDFFLNCIARRRCANLHRSEKRRKIAEERAAEEFLNNFANRVEVWSREGIILVEDMLVRKKIDQAMEWLVNPRDRSFLAAWFADWHTEPLAAILGVGNLPAQAQTQTVKRTKDRIMKILKRAVAKWRRSKHGEEVGNQCH